MSIYICFFLRWSTRIVAGSGIGGVFMQQFMVFKGAIILPSRLCIALPTMLSEASATYSKYTYRRPPRFLGTIVPKMSGNTQHSCNLP